MKLILFLAGLLLCAGTVQAEPTPVRLQSRTIVPNTDVSIFTNQAPPVQTRYLFVQLRDGRSPGSHAELSGLGVRFLRSVPDDTWIVSVPPEAWSSEFLQQKFHWAAAIAPNDKVPRRIMEGHFGDWALRTGGRVALRIRFHDGVDPEDVSAALRTCGAVLQSQMSVFPGWNVVMEASRVLEVAALEEVLWISEAIPKSIPENDGLRESSGAGALQSIGAGLTGAGVKIGVMEQGAVDHPDLNDHLTMMEEDFDNSHAFHVCGILASNGVGSEAEGGTPLQWRGMAPEAELLVWIPVGDVIGKYAEAISIHDIDLHNNSWGFGVTSANCENFGIYDLIVPDIDALIRGAAGKRVQIVFSGGNERDDNDCPLVEDNYGCLNPPKAAKNILVVGAIHSDNDTMTRYSSWGPTNDGRLKPDVVAPGDEDEGDFGVFSTLRPPFNYGGPTWYGTSMAAPAATGVLAQLMELNEQVDPGIQLEPSYLRATLAATAVDLGNPGPDYAFGHGRIAGVPAAASVANETRYVFSIADSAVVEFPFHVPSDAEQVRIVMAWDDPDALPMAAHALVNDLDLLLIAPDANEYHPWTLDPLLPSLDAVRGPDHTNNIEHVTVENPTPGIWTARVTAHDVPEGPQIVSLVGIDLKAPPIGPENLTVSNPQNTNLNLTWSEDRTYDYYRTVLVRYTGELEWSGPVDGEVLLAGQEVAPDEFVAYVGKDNHEGFPFTDGGLDAGTEYNYLGYIVDDSWNFSPSDSTSGTTTNVSSVGANPTLRFALRDPSPNPAQGSGKIVFGLPSPEKVQLSIFDPTGRRIRVLVDEFRPAGVYSETWNGLNDQGRRVAPGVFFYELRAGKRRATKQVSWLR